MPITIDPKPRFDTRGLPDGMDPDQLYRYRYDTLASSAVGFESLLYKLMPYSVVRTFAFAIDPTYRFKISPGTITAANRTKYRSTASVINIRKSRRKHSLESWGTRSNYEGVSICNSPFTEFNAVFSDPDVVSSLPTQPPTVDTLKDTTNRTRLIGSTQGELEFFKSELFSPPRTSYRYEYYRSQYTHPNPNTPDCIAVGGSKDNRGGRDERWSESFEPSAATLSTSVFNALKAQEIAFCKELSSHYAFPLMKAANPFRREYTLTRNVVELRDLARSMLSLRQTADDLKAVWNSLGRSPKTRDQIFDLTSKAASNLPSEYLSYHFGWKLLYKDLYDLLRLPEKLTKRINFLIRRSGKASTFRAMRESASSVTGVSGFAYTISGYDSDSKSESRIERLSETRIVVNAIFDFPPANVPSLRRDFFLDKVGLIPRFIDVYNIIPWTWLVDWFTGFGNYLELIEEINHDPSLINWGLITSNTRGKLITEFYAKNRTRNIVSNNLGGSGTFDTFADVRHTSVLEYECQVRSNVANALSVQQTTIPSSLTTYQKSILGALLAQRIDDTRSGAFRPRS